jgi:hypothetical protein
MSRLPKALRVSRAMTPSAMYTREEYDSIRVNGPPGSVGQDVQDALRGNRSIDQSTAANTIASIANAAANSHRRRGG